MDIKAIEVQCGGYGVIAEECVGLRDRIRKMRLQDKKLDKGLYGRMLGISSH